mmetsp:Transcript_5016/g.7620  ORF Transcript_5016/g.7620 Transcript_5016/m.7620 type:complete len:250 (-) Transcript_5016:1423-2172(-)
MAAFFEKMNQTGHCMDPGKVRNSACVCSSHSVAPTYKSTAKPTAKPTAAKPTVNPTRPLRRFKGFLFGRAFPGKGQGDLDLDGVKCFRGDTFPIAPTHNQKYVLIYQMDHRFTLVARLVRPPSLGPDPPNWIFDQLSIYQGHKLSFTMEYNDTKHANDCNLYTSVFTKSNSVVGRSIHSRTFTWTNEEEVHIRWQCNRLNKGKTGIQVGIAKKNKWHRSRVLALAYERNSYKGYFPSCRFVEPFYPPMQ